MKNFLKLIIILLIFIAPAILSAKDSKFPGKHQIKDPERYLQSVDDRAVGLLDKGELSNLFSNYGVISEYHFGTPALHWPKDGTDVQHYGFGVSLILVADDSVITSIYDQSSAVLDFGWEAADGSKGLYFNPDRNEFNTAGDEVTAFLAFSDRRETWPLSGGVPFWPGYFRENLAFPGAFVENEFVSDRWNKTAYRLRYNNKRHCLPVCHTKRVSCLCLPVVDGLYCRADYFCGICRRVERKSDERSKKTAVDCKGSRKLG